MSFTFVIVSPATLLRQLLRDKIESALAACCLADCARFADLPADLAPIDLVLIDADDDGSQAGVALQALVPARRFRYGCFLTGTRGSFLAHRLHDDDQLRGIVHCADALDEALRAFADIAGGATRLSRHVDQAERRLFAGVLSPREAELAEAFTHGASIEVLAARFGLSPDTVRTHRRNLLLKLGAHQQTDLIRFALGSGLVPLGEFLARGGSRPFGM